MKSFLAYWRHPATAYIAPFVLFAVFLSLESVTANAVYWLYPVKTVAVAALIALLWKRLDPLAPRSVFLSILVGVLGFVLWVGLDPVLVSRTDFDTGFNPWRFAAGNQLLAWILIFFRIAGAALVVPITEEIFWRGFLMRYLIHEDFTREPLGKYSHFSFWVTTAAFASVHGAQWPLAVVVGILYGGWFLRTKSLGNVILAHGVTNLLLGLYVLYSQRWYFW
jgi:CAAX prenyl protease-like protein